MHENFLGRIHTKLLTPVGSRNGCRKQTYAMCYLKVLPCYTFIIFKFSKLKKKRVCSTVASLSDLSSYQVCTTQMRTYSLYQFREYMSLHLNGNDIEGECHLSPLCSSHSTKHKDENIAGI